MWIDIGAESREEAEKLVSVGDPVALRSNFRFLGANRFSSKGTDDKIGAFIVAETMRALAKRKLNVAVYGVGTVQEEVGLRGAKAAAWSIAPDVGIAVDVTDTGDAPCAPEVGRMAVKVGAGPTVKYKDSSLLCNPQVIAHLIKSAKKAGVAYQNEVLVAVGTDAGAMQRSRGGVLSGAVSLPCRNIHNPGEVVSLSDLEGAAKLIAAAAELEF